MTTTPMIMPATNIPIHDLFTPSTTSSTASSFADSAEPSQRCISHLCPISFPHDRGLYLYPSPVALKAESRRIFAPSVPSPDILAAYERCITLDGTRTDLEMWVAFHEVHVEPLLGDINAVWIAPLPTIQRNDDIDFGEDEDGGSTRAEADGKAESCRHPFGVLNPPDEVWEAHRRIVLGAGVVKDQTLVDEFAVKNAYYGTGLGKQESTSRRFKVRRPRYSAGIRGKLRRIEEVLHSKRIKH
ncbi:hypothetical protein BDR22DRAFT_892301 [Usnea florida]